VRFGYFAVFPAPRGEVLLLDESAALGEAAAALYSVLCDSLLLAAVLYPGRSVGQLVSLSSFGHFWTTLNCPNYYPNASAALDGWLFAGPALRANH
jgi:hypothetical protein